MTAPVVATFTFARDEYALAMRRHYKSALNISRDFVVGIVAVALGLYLAVYSGVGWIAWIMFGFGIVLLLMVAYAMLLLPNWLYSSQPKLKNEYRLTFTDGGIGFKTDNLDAALEWAMYQSWLFDKDFYIMYHGKRDLSVIPRRALTHDDADKRLREMLKTHIGPPRS